MSIKVKVSVDGRWYSVEVLDLQARPIQVVVDGETVEVDTEDLPFSPPASERVERADTEPAVEPRATPPPTPKPTSLAAAPPSPGARVFSSPMPGIIVSVSVDVGTQVVTGDDVCVLEAMKMQQTLRADWSGIVSAVHVQDGQQVAEGDPIVSLE